MQILKRGYYPRGGGEVYLKSKPLASTLNPINITEFGTLTRIYGRAFVAGALPIKIAHMMADRVKSLFSSYKVPVEMQVIN